MITIVRFVELIPNKRYTPFAWDQLNITLSLGLLNIYVRSCCVSEMKVNLQPETCNDLVITSEAHSCKPSVIKLGSALHTWLPLPQLCLL